MSFENRLTQYENYWTCLNCFGKELPFYGVRDLDELDSVIPDSESENECYIDSHWEKLSQHSKHLRLCHLNCQSLLSTFDEFVHLVSKYKLDILTLSETWLRNNVHQIAHIQIPGNSFAFKNRGEKRGGGVAVYLGEELKCKERTDLMRLEPSVEHIWIEISGKNKNSNVLLGVFYQPDSDPVKKCAWVEKFETILAAVHSKWDGILVIAGDINIDITNPSSFAQKYQGILRSFNLNQHIKDPTRKGKWLIDHIATNIPNNVIAAGVIPTPEVSDHDMPYIIVNARLSRFEARFKYIRSVKSFCSEDFVRDVSELPFSLVYAVDDPDEKISILNDLLRTCIDRHAPLVRCKITRPPAPWLKDVNIQNLQSERDRLRFTAHQTQAESDWSLYRSIRNRIKTVIKTAKRTFYSKALSSKRSKVVWSIIHRILNPSRKRIRQDPDDLNKFFVTTSERILGTYPEQRTDVVAYLDSLPEISGKTSFEMRKVHFYEVNKQLNSIRNDCSTGHDHLPVYYLKLASQYIVSPLTHIINECIAQNKFPSSWKIGRISPIPKINVR